MKRLFCALILISIFSSVQGQELICGYRGKFELKDSAGVKQGLSVEMRSGDAVVGQTIPLRLSVQEKPTDTPVDNLQIEHEKYIHLIGVRDDLSEFTHLHPQKVVPGLWQVNHSFTNGGRYQFWADVKSVGTVYSFRQPPLTISGRMNFVVPPVVPQLIDRRDNYQTSLILAQPLVVGNTNALEIIVRDSSTNQLGMEFFLGSIMHLVIIKDDLSVYLHGHAENHDNLEKTVRFKQVFPKAGNYKLFAQFRPQGAPLGRDDSVLAEFWVNVKKSD